MKDKILILIDKKSNIKVQYNIHHTTSLSPMSSVITDTMSSVQARESELTSRHKSLLSINSVGDQIMKDPSTGDTDRHNIQTDLNTLNERWTAVSWYIKLLLHHLKCAAIILAMCSILYLLCYGCHKPLLYRAIPGVCNMLFARRVTLMWYWCYLAT